MIAYDWMQLGQAEKAVMVIEKAETLAETAHDWITLSESPILGALGKNLKAFLKNAKIQAADSYDWEMIAARLIKLGDDRKGEKESRNKY